MKEILFGLLLIALLLPAAVQAQTPTPSPPVVPTLPSVAGKPLLGDSGGPRGRVVSSGGVTTFVPEASAVLSSKAPRVVADPVPIRIQKLYEATRLPIARLLKMTDAEILLLYKQNAQRLRADVYELQANGTYLQTGWKNRPPVSPGFQPIVPGGPDRPGIPGNPDSMDTSTIYAAYQPEQAGALALDYLRFATAITWARNYMESLTQFPATRGFTKEYPGVPVWIDTINGPAPTIRMVGHYNSDRAKPFAKIQDVVVGPDYEYLTLRWEDGDGNDSTNNEDIVVWADRWYFPFNSDPNATAVRYSFTVLSWTGLNAGTDMYLGNTLLVENIGSKTLPYRVRVDASRANSYFGGLPALRYTYRHATALARYTYHMQGKATEAGKLWNSLSEQGFWNDLYAPIYGDNTALPHTWFVSDDAYKECDNPAAGADDAPYPWGVHENVTTRYMQYYPYESKVCAIGRPVYIALSRLDNLVPALQAIHILNQHGDPDYAYTNSIGLATTPRQAARALENYAWNGYGIKIYGKDALYSSGVRTNVFLVLETLLGYKYGDATSRGFADQTAILLLDTQWGTNSNSMYQGDTADNAVLLRSPQIGGQLIGWKRGSGSYPYALPPLNLLSDIVDLFAMPLETGGVVTTNAESTGTFLQALRVYMRYRYQVWWGAGVMP